MLNWHGHKQIAAILVVIIPALLACSLLSVLRQAQAPSSGMLDSLRSDEQIRTILANYQTWTRLNDEPRNVSVSLWNLCRLPSPEEQAYLDGPHAQFYVNVYVNAVGFEQVMQAGPRTLPMGTIVVKEKLATLNNDRRNELGIMIKSDSKTWQYLYWDNRTLYQSPKDLAHCIECHSAEIEGDSVFWPLSSDNN